MQEFVALCTQIKVLAKTKLPKAQEIFQNVKPQYFSPEKLFIHLKLAAHEKPKFWPFRILALAFSD